jgi:hypothetical protein
MWGSSMCFVEHVGRIVAKKKMVLSPSYILNCFDEEAGDSRVLVSLRSQSQKIESCINQVASTSELFQRMRKGMHPRLIFFPPTSPPYRGAAAERSTSQMYTILSRYGNYDSPDPIDPIAMGILTEKPGASYREAQSAEEKLDALVTCCG